MKKTRAGVDRRRLLGIGGAAAASLAAPAIARAETPVIWKMATAWPRNGRGGGANARRLADWIQTLSAGRLTVEVFAAGEISAPGDVFDAVSAGTAELGHGTSSDWRARDPAFHFFAGVPFGLSGHEQAGWLRFGGGQSLWRRAYEPFGVLPFLAGSTGVPSAAWFRDPIAEVGDLMNVPMRAEGLSGEIWRRLGANIEAIPEAGVASALRSGTVVAAEVAGPWRDYDVGLAAVVENYYLPGFRAVGPTLELIVNRVAYDRLPDDLKAVVRGAAAAAALEAYADFTYNNIIVLPLVRASGAVARELPNPIVRAAGREADALLSEVAGRSPMASETYQSFIDFRKRAVEYTSAGDAVALRLRQVGLGG